MQVKKEIFLFCALIALSASLLIAANLSTNVPAGCNLPQDKKMDCCQEMMKNKAESPWNFITGGILHLSV
jgi:hypothetical protein